MTPDNLSMTARLDTTGADVDCNGVDDDCDGLVDEGLSAVHLNAVLALCTKRQRSCEDGFGD